MNHMGIVQAKLVGGLGNQLFSYCGARKYSELTGSRLEVGDWIGRRIFGLDDPYPSCTLPERNDGGNGDPAHAVRWGETDIQLGGYFQFQDWVGRLSRAEVKRWFTVLPHWLAAVPLRPRPYIAAHLRQGDYLHNPQFCNVSRQSYLACVQQHDLPDRLVWVDQANPVRLKVTDNAGLYDLPDFITLMQADVILRANSTFSWWAATLSDAHVFSPVVGDLVGPNDVSFVAGNHARFGDVGRLGVRVTDLYLPD
jgi:hypothetical protein